MENKINKEVVVENNYKVNRSFFNFIKEVKDIKDINLIEKKYKEIVKKVRNGVVLDCEWNNRKNIIKRNLRKEVEEKRNILLKEIGVKEEEFKIIIEKIRVSNNNNYF
jgi:hypothetical protein